MSEPTRTEEVVYPDSDGQPMAENTEQFHWIVTVKSGLDRLFDGRPDVFVAGDLLWYPVQGRPDVRLAPDAMVAFGRPPGRRGSYIQWNEGGVAPQFVCEVLSPGNTRREMRDKRAFYQRYRVEEYVEYDPDRGTLAVWVRDGDELVPVPDPRGWVSPRLGVRFDLDGHDLALTYADGTPFQTYLEVVHERDAATRQAETQRRRADKEQRLAENQRKLREQAEERAEQERQRRLKERKLREKDRQRLKQEQDLRQQADERAARLAEKLRAMGVDPDDPT